MTGMRFCSTDSGSTHCFCDSVQQLTQKDKVLWKGASQGSMQEQDLSTPSVTLVLYKLALSLSRGRGEKAHGQEKGEKTALPWLMSGSPLTTQTMFVPSNIGFDPGWSCFFFLLFLLLLFCAFAVFFFFSFFILV